MDLKKVFIKGSCPKKVGGQAVLEGIMMKSEDRTSIVLRLPDKSLHIKTEKLPKQKKWTQIPFLRGIFVFVDSLVQGMKTLMYSADVLEEYEGEGALEDDRFSLWLEKKFGKKGAWNIMIYSSVVISVLFTVGVFIIAPTAAVSWLKHFTESEFLLNLAEGVLRIVAFVLYVVLIARMEEIKKVFQYHGAEHKCIHCLETEKELTVENCRKYGTLHPRCGTSFLMFVFVIALVLFSLLGWPDLLFRIISRILLIPVIAGLSFELLKWAGRSDNWVVKILSIPGLLMQMITTKEPDDGQLQVAIAALKAATAKEGEFGQGACDNQGKMIKEEEDVL